MKKNIHDKYDYLKTFIGNLGNAVIAFSGGVDSTFLLKVAYNMLGDSVIAMTAVSPTYPSIELEDARTLAKAIGVKHVLVKTGEFEDESYLANTPDRCFFCKQDLFLILREEADKAGIEHIIYGANADDLKDFRPGMKAAEKANAIAPLLEAGLTKDEIRILSKELGLSIWNKPSFACLASRIPYGTRITEKVLSRIEHGEELLRKLGFKQLRLRYHGDIARIEVLPEDISGIVKQETRVQILKGLKKLGFKYVTIDLEGYRTGSMNPPK